MSAALAIARVDELQAMLGTLRTGAAATQPQAAASATTSFASALQSAQGTSAASPAVSTSGDTTAYDGLITSAASKYGIDPAVLKGLIRQESNFNPNAGSPAGAQGLTQLMPGTARGLGVTDASDPAQAIDAGAKLLRQDLDTFGGDVKLALAAYNAGAGAVKKYGGIPPYAETQAYVPKVLAYADGYRGTL